MGWRVKIYRKILIYEYGYLSMDQQKHLYIYYKYLWFCHWTKNKNILLNEWSLIFDILVVSKDISVIWVVQGVLEKIHII